MFVSNARKTQIVPGSSRRDDKRKSKVTLKL